MVVSRVTRPEVQARRRGRAGDIERIASAACPPSARRGEWARGVVDPVAAQRRRALRGRALIDSSHCESRLREPRANVYVCHALPVVTRLKFTEGSDALPLESLCLYNKSKTENDKIHKE